MVLRRYRYLLLLLILLGMGRGDVRAQQKSPSLPLGPSNVGRDFWVAFPANSNFPGEEQYYLRLYITSSVKTQVRLWTGASRFRSVVTRPNDVVTIDLNPLEGQIVTRADYDPVPDDQIYKKRGVHIEADAPIAIYGMNRTSYTSDGMLLLPTNALGRSYIVASYAAATGGTQEMPSQFIVIAPYNNTQVTIKQPMRTPNHPEGAAVSFTLDSGDVYSAMSVGYGGDMSGAEIIASKPVAVTAGQSCAYIPNQLEFCCCNHLEEMMLPVEAWGMSYHGVPVAKRLKGDIWRVFASQPDTKIMLNGSPFATLSMVGGQRGDGWFEYRANGQELIEWTANKPIYVAQYNASQYYDNVASDPFYMMLTPLEQYQLSGTFTTPGGDFSWNYLNLVVDSAGYYDIEIAPQGSSSWQKISTYPGAGVPRSFASTIGGRRFIGVTITINPGSFRIRGTKPFAGYLYGFGDFDAYGYPLSMAVVNLRNNDTDAPTLNRIRNAGGTVNVIATDQPADPAIRTNIATIEMDPDSSSNYNIAVDYFEAGIARKVGYTLTVRDKSRPARAIVYVSDGAGNMTTDLAEYRPSSVTMAPSPLEYGPMTIGADQTHRMTITNYGGTEVNIQEVLLKKKTPGFTLPGQQGGFVLGPAGSPTSSREVELKFTATALGAFEDSVGLRIGSVASYSVVARARVGNAVIGVSGAAFGMVPVNTSSDRTITVSNMASIGNGTLTVTGATGPSNAAFTLPDGMPAFPLALAPGAMRTIRVRFTPTTGKSYIDRITFTSNAASGDSIAELTGESGQPRVIATSLTWDARHVKTGPYRSNLYLKNLGAGATTLNGVGEKIGDVADFTLANIEQIKGTLLNPGDSVIVQVDFQPQAVGQRTLYIYWDISSQQADIPMSRLVGTGIDPSSGVSGDATGESFALEQNMPNPVATTTTIAYTIAARAHTTLTLYDTKGSVVRRLVDAHQLPGRYEMTLDAEDIASGSYYYTLVSGNASQTRTLTIVR